MLALDGPEIANPATDEVPTLSLISSESDSRRSVDPAIGERLDRSGNRYE